MLLTRVATAVVGIPLIALAIWLGGGVLGAVVAVAAFIAVYEIAVIRGTHRSVEGMVSSGLAGLMPVAALAGEDWLLGTVVLTVLVLGGLFARTQSPETALASWLWSICPSIYVGLLSAHFVLLREDADGRDWLFFGVLTVWITDTGAYAVGRAIGRHKLAPVVSPGKTIEGGIGSFIAGFAAVFGLTELLELDVEFVHQVALGLLLPPVILVGDLAESALKRGLDVKDSGFLVPGHGGILDRLDSLLFAIPVVYYFVKWITQ